MGNSWQKLACSTCGGVLEYKGNLLVCKYCKSSYEKNGDAPEDLIIQLNGANVDKNRFRFDDALEKYSLVLREYPNDEEANWGAFLCDYGVIYEEDYDGQYKPTCHRLSERPVEKSPYYARLNAEQKRKAADIEKLRQRIFAEMKKIQPYDVFICYKQNQERGGVSVPTREAKWARDAYEMLTRQGLRVFYAEKSLAGSNVDYEPHIYAALRSAKLMFVLTTSLDNLHSVWVANEWKRYVSYIRAGEDKTVRVVYDSIEPYDLPKELQAKQAIDQDGDWMGAINAAVAEIFQKAPELQKRRTYEEKTYTKKQVQGVQVQKRELQTFERTAIPASESTQLKTAESMMSVGEYKGAMGILRGVLAANRACTRAYLDLFFCENECGAHEGFFTSAKKPVADFKNYEAALASATEEEKGKILDILYQRACKTPQVETFEEFIALPGVTDSQIFNLQEKAYAAATRDLNENLFASLIKTVDDTSLYVRYNFGMGKALVGKTPKLAMKYFDNVLDVDEGHKSAMLYKLMAEKGATTLPQLYAILLNGGDFSRIEKIYEYGYYAELTQGLFDAVLGALEDTRNTAKALKLADFVLSVLPETMNAVYATYLDLLKGKLLRKGQYAAAVKYIDRKLAFNANDDNAYFEKVLAKNKTGDVLQLAKIVDTIMEDEDFLNAINVRAKTQPDEAENLYMQVYKKLVFAKKQSAEHNFPLEKYKQIYAPTVSDFLAIKNEDMGKFFKEKAGQVRVEASADTALICSIALVAMGLLMIFVPHIPFVLLHYGWWIAIFLVGGFVLFFIGVSLQPKLNEKGEYVDDKGEEVKKFSNTQIKGILIATASFVATVLMIVGMCVTAFTEKTFGLYNAFDFRLMNNLPFATEANFQLKNDIDFKGGSFKPMATGSHLSEQYSGTFDGQGHTLKNIKVNATKDRGGILMKYNGGKIINVTFENVEVVVDSWYDKNDGVTYGYSEACSLITYNYGTIENVTLKNYNLSVVGKELHGHNYSILLYQNYGAIKDCRLYDCGVTYQPTGEAWGYSVVDYTGSKSRHTYVNKIEVFNNQPLPEGKEIKVVREIYNRQYYNYTHYGEWVIATSDGYTEYHRPADAEWVTSNWGDYPTPCTTEE